MATIRIKDLPRDRKISKDEMKSVLGGVPMTSPVGRDPQSVAFGTPVGFCPSVAWSNADQTVNQLPMTSPVG